MKISIIIPAFNCSKYINNVVESIYRSQLTDFEIIIVNDGSNDNTGDVSQQISNRHVEVRVVEQENGGVSAARNRGIQEAAGEYLMFADADDSLEDGSLAEVNAILEAQHPDMLLFGMSFDYYFHGCRYRSDVLFYPKRGSMSAKEWGTELEQLFQTNMLSPVWNKMIRRELVTKNNIAFRSNMIEMEDYLFSIECLSRCDQIFLLDKAAYHYRQTEDERGTFRRLWKIGSLSTYVQPFYETAGLFGTNAKTMILIAHQIYSMLFHEQIRFASVEQIRTAANDMLSGKNSAVIRNADEDLYLKLKKRQFTYVWLEQTVSRIRHWAAVQLKYMRSLMRSK